jgi:hypothetical protein
VGDFLDLFGTFGVVAWSLLLVAYVFERWFNTAWLSLHGSFTLRQLVREWLLYTLLFAGLGTLLKRVLMSACSVSC